MNQQAEISKKRKAKTAWQLFTNNGKFDSKLPPSRRLKRKHNSSHPGKVSSNKFCQIHY